MFINQYSRSAKAVVGQHFGGKMTKILCTG